ncbi:protein kinase domain [Coleofasciculus chthonoplastes PCC 7420]|uniref:non-specific serine/threonine protein kinase n=1 Tax=Coleofasciculus chthonoplastes PCC 7420 TaxID=118168 RepID=B4VYP7_9CYAN|nr:protein kinase [Coleofasciculus chthonoplastes]EDX72940.1 protein kinase domain [Coleofasciculus chthonoplastes PCC 7420]
MNNSSPTPSTSRPRYQKIRELGRNRAGGRITYLAKDNKTQQPVVIKRFLFAQAGSDWSGFKAYQREIQLLQGLDHPGIPRYLDSFETKAGFCMVQEYKKAQSLAIPRSFEPEQIKQIAIATLEILLYLQRRLPIVIHRDIKPENLLVDEQINVYLVDFGLARMGGSNVAMSSVAAGTFGFMAPEQLYNHKLTGATDLYGLGATLISLLTGTKSIAMDTLINEEGQIHFQHLLPQLSLRFVTWLEKMVQPKARDRYIDAAAALEALKPIDLIRTPEVKLSQEILEFRTTHIGEKLTQIVTVENSIPETVLEGTWQVAPHPSDPRFRKQNSHLWITFEPARFQGNQVECKIRVDTNRLMANQTYKRRILLQTNAVPETHSLELKVNTNFLALPKPPWISLGLLFGLSGIVTWLLAGFVAFFIAQIPILGYWIGTGFIAAFVGGVVLSVLGVRGVPITKTACSLVGIMMVLAIFVAGFLGTFLVALVGLAGLITGFIAGAVIKNYRERGFSPKIAMTSSLLMTGLGMSLGIGYNFGFVNFWLLVSTIGSSLALVSLLINPYLQRRKRLEHYNQSAKKRRLIKP